MTKDFNRYYFSRQMFIGATMFLASVGVASASPTALGMNVPESDVFMASPQQAQKTVSGVVEDQFGPVAGANVVEKGTTNGTITDMDGKFTLNVSPNAVLVVSFIGYTEQQITVGNQTSFKIQMKEDSQALDEVVVVGYGTQKKVNLTGSVSSVDFTEQAASRPITNVSSALGGLSAGLQVMQSKGNPTDDGATIRVRGTGTLNNASPLVLVDGMEASMDAVNPQDIETISVLKDAASAAIYGSRAANGVILITTKKGNREKIRVTYSGTFSMAQPSNLLDFVTDYPTHMRLINEAKFNEGYNDVFSAATIEAWEAANADPNGLNANGVPNWLAYPNTDWNKEMYKNNLVQDHVVSVNGGSEKVTFLLSAGYMDNPGLVENTGLKRYTLRANVEANVNKWLTLGTRTYAIMNDKDQGNYADTGMLNFIRQTTPGLIGMYDGKMGYKEAAEESSTANNIWAYLKQTDGQNRSSRFNTTMYSKIKFMEGLSWDFNFNYGRRFDEYNSHTVPLARYTFSNGEIASTATTPDQMTTTWKSYAEETYTLENILRYDKSFKGGHDLNVMVGYNEYFYKQYEHKQQKKGLIDPSISVPDAATEMQTSTGTAKDEALRSVFGRLNYIFNNKYILAFNGRYDGTSRFPHDDRYAFNPSGSVAWVLSEENFFEPVRDVVNFLKLRFSYGSLGNQDLKENYYAYLATMGSGKISQILDGKQPIGVSAPGLVAGNLTWEKVTTADWGMDINFLDNRLTATVDGYIRRTKDMLTGGAELPNVLGTSEPLENAADLKTTGWDLTVSWRDNVKLAGKTLNYGLSFNIGDSRSWITKFSNDTGSLDSYYEGWEMGSIWGLETEGFFTSQEDIDNHADQTQVASYIGTRPIAPGDLKFKDLNGDGKIDKGAWTIDDHGDYKIIGNSRARYGFGFNMNADWNGFDLSLFVQGVLKKNYSPSGDLYFWGIYAQPWTNITYGNYYDRWTEENPSQDAYFPRFKSYVAEGGAEAALTQTRYLQNATYARLKNLTFGYTLPKQWTDKANIQRLRLFFSGDNLCEITGLYKHYKLDPECLGGQMYPLQRSYSFGLNVTF